MAVSIGYPVVLAPDSPRLRRVLRSTRDQPRFRDIPVDWHDPRAGTWRPTAIAQPGAGSAEIHVFVPIDDGIAMAPAPVAALRVARGQSDAVMRFWTIRYRLRLLRMLAASLEPDETAAVDQAVAELSGAEAEMRDVWLTAYAHGIPPRARRTLLRPSDVRVVGTRRFEQAAMAGRCPLGPGGLLTTALDLYGGELTRIQGALRDAGLTPPEIKRHPMTAALTVLVASATAELLRCEPMAGDDVALDAAVWGA